ncbi:response regulator transcription factor [Neptunicella marina]|uniref:Phosphate regulon transcriptional regulatory protein PhoB n=1 Tax=Neptunicella marina TaxID=2125989 RepID=A0A8J6IZ89_9ALTE|nr:response regulator transcription factor [Neptunicella marina]MBC3767715.1 response regulator transcription factor [Neptunicella marina]
MQEKVMVVEDDADIADLIRVNLAELGLAITHLARGDKACEQALTQPWDLLLLDVMLPGMSGLDICRKVRETKPEQAILMLTAKNSETDRVLGLELGADDYMTKPFSVRELQARVRSHLRRARMMKQLTHEATVEQHNRTEVNQLIIDGSTHQASLRLKPLDLTSTEFDLLHFLARHPNQVFSRAQLLESVWGYHHSGYEHTVNSHINRLRAKIEKNVTEPQIVQTVWGVGYKFNPSGVL